jgi:hypothetical protein
VRALEARDEARSEARDETRGQACGVACGVATGGAAEDLAGPRAGGDLFLVDSVLLEQLELIARDRAAGSRACARYRSIEPRSVHTAGVSA